MRPRMRADGSSGIFGPLQWLWRSAELGQSFVLWRAIAHHPRIRRAVHPTTVLDPDLAKLKETAPLCAAERNAPVVSFGHRHPRSTAARLFAQAGGGLHYH